MVKLVFTDDPSPDQVAVLSAVLRAYTAAKSVQARNPQAFAFFVQNDLGENLGGIQGHTVWNDLIVERLALPVDLRGQSIGKELLAAAEDFAKRKNCYKAYVETGSWQAPGFYTRCGYQEHSRKIDHPNGHDLITFMKRLVP